MSDSDYSDVDCAVHDELLENIRDLDKKNLSWEKKTRGVSLKKSTVKVDVNDLLKTITSTRNVGDIKKKLATADVEEDDKKLQGHKKLKLFKQKKKKVLDTPLHRQEKNRVESQIVYKNVKKELHQWNPIIHKNRVAEQICFPLEQSAVSFEHTQTAAEKSKEFQPKTELERLTALVLGNSKYNITNDNAYSEAEKEVIKAMSVRQAREKCAELQKMRALMNYRAIKNKRESKIKSKQYHRIRKREARRKLMKEIEALVLKDPEEAKNKLKELEKNRSYERATLKHRSANKWSRQMQQFASRNPELRKLVDEHFRLGTELKSHNDIGEILEEDEEDVPEKKLTIGEIVEAATEQANEVATNLPIPITSMQNPFMKSALEAIRTERQMLLENAKTRAAIDKKLQSAPNNIPIVLKSTQVINLPDDLINGEKEYDAEMQDNFLAEAYGEDDVLDDFTEEKERVKELEEPKVIDNNLNGWGSWTGAGIKDKKKEKFIIRPKKNKRKDADKPNVIIREKISKVVADLQPRDVPFPFAAIQDYEAYLQQPLGRDWNTEYAQKQLNKPRIVTKAGRIIRSLNKEVKQKYYASDSD